MAQFEDSKIHVSTIFEIWILKSVCDSSAMLYQLNNQVNWKLIMEWVHLNLYMIEISA